MGSSGDGLLEKQEQQDEALLSSLGVTSANAEDLERTLLAQVKQKVRISEIESGKREEGADGEEEEEEDGGVAEVVDVDGLSIGLSDRRGRLQRSLAALDREIAAVADGAYVFEQGFGEEEENNAVGSLDQDAAGRQKGKGVLQGLRVNTEAVNNGVALHRALANDRLKSLLRKRKQLSRELEALEPSDEDEDRLRSLVAEATGNSRVVQARRSEVEVVILPSASKSTAKKKKAVSFLEDDNLDAALDDAASGLVETERDRLIRTGKLTPFHQVKGFERRVQSVASRSDARILSTNREEDEHRSRQSIAKVAASLAAIAESRPSTQLLDASQLPDLEPPTREFRRLRTPLKSQAGKDEDGEKTKVQKKREKRRRGRPLPEKKWRMRQDLSSDETTEVDEEDESWTEDEDGHPKKRSQAHLHVKAENIEEGSAEEAIIEVEDVVLDGGLKVPATVYDKLFDYQKTAVKWMWELHCQKAGGIIGDEMGLGKTIQVIAFLAALHNSGMYTPSIVICPVTLLQQWRREVRKWYPALSVEVLHDSAAVLSRTKGCKAKNVKTKVGSDQEYEDDETDESEGEEKRGVAIRKENRWDAMIDKVVGSDSGLLITTYEQLRIVREKLLDINWGYAVLDEGHRIRNPDAEITLVCKQLQTVHRIIMTGAPIQNKLTELWSLFDFVFPGKLGVLPVFQSQFALPIAIGGYANATPLQVSTAYRCAVVLRDLIMPYMLRRMKSDVDAQLTKKTEHVLFCSLTDDQRAAYRAFLASSEVEQIFNGNRNSLYGIDILRKICNHPDLLEREHSCQHPDYGNPERSGKLKVLVQVLDLWNTQGHRVLLFTQTQQMLDIIENYVISKGFVYRRMDGSTPIKQRMSLIDEFNEGAHVFIFILTTKVGGLGTNLIGANRVVIFDPDWNPSTDIQARERAWRIGQTRDVTIYRLITRGTIEEKIYHRQIYKHFLTNKILRDPQQRRFFKARDMRDLFTLQEDVHASKTETSTLFAEVGGDVPLRKDGGSVQTTRNVGTSRQGARKHRGHAGRGVDLKRESVDDLDTGGTTKELAVDEEPQEDESRILKSLFEVNGIHSAMDHDAILGVHESEKVKIDHEASQIAERAAMALRQSRQLRSIDSVQVPTWTGRSGSAGAPAAHRRRFGSTSNGRLASSSSAANQAKPSDGQVAVRASLGGLAGSLAGKAVSSQDLLSRMHQRHVESSGAGEVLGSTSTASNVGVRGLSSSRSARRIQTSAQPEVLIRQLCTFLQQQGGVVASADVVQHFKDRISTQDVALFRQLLKQIATLQKGTGESHWVLKPEYQDKT